MLTDTTLNCNVLNFEMNIIYNKLQMLMHALESTV